MFLTSAWSGTPTYDSGYCNTNEVFSVLINGGPGWLGHKRTYAINDPFQ